MSMTEGYQSSVSDIPTGGLNPPDFDFNAHYTVDGYKGVAWYASKYATYTKFTCDLVCEDDDCEHDDLCYFYNEWKEIDTDRVVMVMVGDNREFIFDVSDVQAIAEEDYCSECGQIGCTMDGRER